MLDLQQGRHPPVHTIVDLTEIPEMKLLEIRDEGLFIGAGVALSRIARNTLVASHAQALVEASDLVGGPQVRNMATIGGNLCNGVPSADSATPLLALNAVVTIEGRDGSRHIALEDFFLGPGCVALAHHEVLTAITVTRTFMAVAVELGQEGLKRKKWLLGA